MLACLCLTSYLNSSLANHHPACLISSNCTTPLSPVSSTNMHHSSQNQSRHDNLILGLLHIYRNSKPDDVAWKIMETIERLLPRYAPSTHHEHLITPSSKLNKSITLP